MNLIEKIGFKPKNVGLGLDPAHGLNVSGKASPDGLFKECVWSRMIIENIIGELTDVKNGSWSLTSPLLNNPNEIGIANRVGLYNEMSDDYDLFIMLSLHVDAFKNPPAWWGGPGGFTLFTSRGETIADPICTNIGLSLKKHMPEENFRFDYGLSKGEKMRDLDREANFGVIYGYKRNGKLVKTKYAGILIENNFMDVPDNYQKLTNKSWNDKLQGAYVYTILNLMTDLGFENFIDPVIKTA